MTGVDEVRRWRAHVTLLAGLSSLLAGLLIWPQPARAVDNPDPLRVTLSTLSPSSIPRSGPIIIAGQVRNPTDETWELVRVYPVFSAQPMTTPEELAAAAASDPATTASGSRLTGEGQFAEIAELGPGESARFRIRLPRRDLPISGDPGVYWVGAQALGTSSEGRDLLADGRARSFLPLVPRRASAQLSLVAPLRGHIERDVRARVVEPSETAELFTANGRLGRLVAMLAEEPDITWLVDPALLDAAADLGDNNPALSLGPRPPSQEPDDSEPSEEPSPSSDSTPSQGSPAPALDETARQETTEWLTRVTQVLSGATVLALPYADVDALALLRNSSQLLELAQDMAQTRLENRGLASTAAIAPPNRRIDTDLVAGTDTGFVAIADAPVRPSPATASIGDHRVLLTQAAATEGGPGPTRALGALNLRQRLLAEAAVHALAGATDPLVASLPDDWDPGAGWRQADFVDGLRTTWLDLVPAPSAVTGEIEALPYSRSDRRAELDDRLLDQAERLANSSDVLNSLLDTENNVSLRLRGMALAGASYSARADQPSAASLVSTMADTVDGLTNRVSVVGTQFVTLSGGSGTITVSLINGLRQPVKIGLDVRARHQDQLDFDEIEPLTLQPEQRTTVRLQVRTSRLGVNEVEITPTTTSGEQVGTPLAVTIRSSEVGRWFWSVMIGAGAVLVVMIAKRIRDRIRNRRWRPLEDPPADDPNGPEVQR